MSEPTKRTRTAAQKKVAPQAAANTEVEVKAEAAAKTAKKTAKEATVKEAAAKKTAKETAAKKPAARKAAEPKTEIHFQFDGKDLVAKDILDQALKAYKAGHRGVAVKSIELYIVASEGAAYYVVNGEAQDDFKIVL